MSGKNGIFVIAALAGVGVLAVALVLLLVPSRRQGAEASGPEGVVTRVVRGKESAKRRSPLRIKSHDRRARPVSASIARAKPDMTLDAAEEAGMTEEIRAIYKALQEALDGNDRKRVFALVRRLQSLDEWPDGIPPSVKKRALCALASFGSSGVAEAIGFLADSSAEVRNTAIETFEEQLADNWDSGDRKLSEILVALSKVVSDTDALDSFYAHLDEMRPSVRASTVSEIYKGGNDSSKQVLDASLESIFSVDDTTVKTRDDVETALTAAKAEEEANPEKVTEYDELYGPSDWSW